MYTPQLVKTASFRRHLSAYSKKAGQLLAFLLLVLFLVNPSRLTAQGVPGPSVITCPQDIVNVNEPGQCGAHVSFVEAITTDKPYTLIYSKPSGALFPIGTTYVEVRAVDVNAVTIDKCGFNVTVTDNEPPKFSNCQSNITVTNTANLCGAIVNYTRPAVIDQCTFKSKTYNFSGTLESFVVPVGVTSIDVNVTGASGGHTYSNSATYGQVGSGGQVYARMAVTPGQILYLTVGGEGKNGSPSAAGKGGFNGGGDGGLIMDNAVVAYAAGGGGGASDIRTAGTAFSDRIIVAGGGGAPGIIEAGGNGGDVKGQDGLGGTTPAFGGTAAEGGKGGSYADYYFGANGGFGFGGAGAAETAGGGAGGGYYGGGGGSIGSGAGGSSYTYAGAGNVSQIQGSHEGNGSITLSWSQPAILVQKAGLPSGAVFPIGTTVNTFTATDAAGNSSECSLSIIVTDNQKPILEAPLNQTFNNKANSYIIPALVASDNCGITAITYTVTGATARVGDGTDASGIFNPGASVVTWQVIDAHGNVETATTAVNVTVYSPVNVSVADVYAVSPGGKQNTIYIGYGPSQLSVTAVADRGKAPYSYEWTKTGESNIAGRLQTLTVSLPGEYNVTVTDADGNTATAKKIIQTIDVRCGRNNDKVLVAQSKKESSKPVCTDNEAVSVMLSKGGYLGEYSSSVSGARLALEESPKIVVEASYKIDVFPNPTTGIFSVQLSNFSCPKAEVLLLTANGVAVQKKTVELTGDTQRVEFNINNLNTGVYFVKVISDNGIQTVKEVIKQWK